MSKITASQIIVPLRLALDAYGEHMKGTKQYHIEVATYDMVCAYEKELNREIELGRLDFTRDSAKAFRHRDLINVHIDNVFYSLLSETVLFWKVVESVKIKMAVV